MIGAILLCLAQAGDGEPADLRWPVGDGEEPPALYTGYGQATDQGAPIPHRGLDILPPRDWRRVYAIERGVVIDVRLSNDGEAGVLIERASPLSSGRKRALWYLHLDAKTIRVKRNAVVREDQWLGSLSKDEDGLLLEHLHLSRLEGDYQSVKWHQLDTLAVRNPLLLIDQSYQKDQVAPKCHALENGPFGFLRHATGEALTDASHLPADAIDIVAHVDDEAHLSPDLSPVAMHLELTRVGDASPETFDLRLDGRLPEAGLYCEKPPYEAHGTHDVSAPIEPAKYLFLLTWNKVWKAAPGAYTLKLVAEDSLGNSSSTLTQTVTVRP